MKFEDMKLIYGYPLQLQTSNLAGQPERFSCRLIGCLPGRSILLSVPKVAGKLVRFRTGQKVVARLMVDNGIGIFASLVDTQTMEPYPILHIGYPDNVSFKGIRGATRVSIEQPVDVTNMSKVSDRVLTGSIVDISITGARIEISSDVGEVGNHLRLNMRVDIAGIIRDLAIEAVIRSRVEAEPGAVVPTGMTTFGLEFIETDEDRRLLLYAYVFSHIGKQESVG